MAQYDCVLDVYHDICLLNHESWMGNWSALALYLSGNRYLKVNNGLGDQTITIVSPGFTKTFVNFYNNNSCFEFFTEH